MKHLYPDGYGLFPALAVANQSKVLTAKTAKQTDKPGTRVDHAVG